MARHRRTCIKGDRDADPEIATPSAYGGVGRARTGASRLSRESTLVSMCCRGRGFPDAGPGGNERDRFLLKLTARDSTMPRGPCGIRPRPMSGSATGGAYPRPAQVTKYITWSTGKLGRRQGAVCRHSLDQSTPDRLFVVKRSCDGREAPFSTEKIWTR